MFPKIRAIFLFLTLNYCDGHGNKNPFNVINPTNLIISQPVNPKPVDSEHLQVAKTLSGFYSNSFMSDSTDSFTNIDEACGVSVMGVVSGVWNKEKYALTMLDSWGKPGSGIMIGNVKWLGSYYECVQSDAGPFHGKYCYVTVGQQHEGNPITGFVAETASLEVGGCFPNTCSQSNISSLLKYLNKNLTSECPVQFDEWKALDIFATILCSALCFLVLVSTMFDHLWPIPVAIEGEVPTGRGHKVVTSFSLIKNTRNILSTTSKPTDIHCLHGLRFISISWVILGHSLLFLSGLSDNSASILKYVFDHWEFQVIINGTFSVDTFFFLSGLLVTYLSMRKLVETGGKMNVLRMYLYRYIRLTPTYAFVILISMSLWLKFGEGPLWPDIGNSQAELCSKYWYSNLLYFNNLYPANVQETCYAVSWYLSNDFQFYLLAPIFLYALYRSPKLGIGLTAFVTISSIAISGGFSIYTKQQPQAEFFGLISASFVLGNNSDITAANIGVPTGNPYISDIYAKPWCRISSYLVGMLTGYFLHSQQNKINMSKKVVAIGWLLAAAVDCSIIYGLYPSISAASPLNLNTAAFYNAVSRPLWCTSLAWITIACVSGNGGPVNRFLSWKVFMPLSRLTYCCYLIHPLVIWWLIASGEKLSHFSIVHLILVFVSSLAITLAVSYVVAALVEFPVLELTKVLMNLKKTVKSSPSALDTAALITEDENQSSISLLA